MGELLGLSFDAAASPSIRLERWRPRHRGPDAPPSGWGFGWYPANEYGAAVIKDPTPTGETQLSRVLRDWERFRATIFVCHIRGAAKRVSQEDTHPFARAWGGRDWLLAHAGDLDPHRLGELDLGDDPVFEPVGRTDSERAFCWLLSRIRECGAKQLADFGWPELHAALGTIDALGCANLLVTDGQDLVAFRSRSGSGDLHLLRRKPPHATTVLENQLVHLDLGDPLDLNRTMVLFASAPLGDEAWETLEPGELAVARRGVLTTRLAPPDRRTRPRGFVDQGSRMIALDTEAETPVDDEAPPLLRGPTALQRVGGLTRGATGISRLNTSSFAGDRILQVTHETIYRYKQSVEHSTHLFRLRPVHDLEQSVIEHALEILPRTPRSSFEDVFGNQATRVAIREPYNELKIIARSRVRVRRTPTANSPRQRWTIPLVWMPWQRQMMLPYLLPPELPESQLRELSDFAMSFVERQDYDLVETLADINATIYHDFKYESHSTTLATTAFDVYVQRRGVCQDFANLFICLARLLSVPARYRVGYIHTGANYENKLQSEASHAWVELYLPWLGWRGYDPTNGCLAAQDHVRIAAGRNYTDAAPTSGTIFKGGGAETLTVAVRVEEPT